MGGSHFEAVGVKIWLLGQVRVQVWRKLGSKSVSWAVLGAKISQEAGRADFPVDAWPVFARNFQFSPPFWDPFLVYFRSHFLAQFLKRLLGDFGSDLGPILGPKNGPRGAPREAQEQPRRVRS